jgi:hypothetical protein
MDTLAIQCEHCGAVYFVEKRDVAKLWGKYKDLRDLCFDYVHTSRDLEQMIKKKEKLFNEILRSASISDSVNNATQGGE